MGVNGIYGLSGSGLDVESMVKAGMLSKQSQLDKMQQTYTKNEWKKEAFLDISKELETFNVKKLTDYKLSSNMNARTATSSESSIKVTAGGSAVTGRHYVEVNSTASNAYFVGTTAHTDYKTSIGTDLEFTLSDGTTTKTIKVDSGSSIFSLFSTMKEKTNITGSYDEGGYVSFYNKELGASNSLSINAQNEKTASWFNSLGIKIRSNSASVSDVSTSTFTSGTAVQGSGTDASAVIDGRTYTLNKNIIEADGIQYNFGNVFSSGTLKAVVNVDQDIDKIVENVKSFVDDYNSILNTIYDAYSESPNSSYKPLTDAQRSSMTEEQIKKWEDKAQAGMLYHDQTIRKILDSVRTSVTSSISGNTDKYNSIFSLGISTKGMHGELQLDETKLRSALADDPDAVYNVFGKPGSDNDDSSNGVAVRLSKALSNAKTSIEKTAGTSSTVAGDSTLDTLMRSLQSRISNFKKMMTSFEENLYKKYDAMESALATLGSQMNYVSSMFS